MKKISVILLLSLLIISSGCIEETNILKNSITELVEEPKGENCSTGGLKIITGMDENNNEVLEENEIENIQYVCNGTDGIDGVDGQSSLLDVVELEAGDSACVAGGYKVMSGMDLNGDSILDMTEVQNVEYICNGEDVDYDKKVILNWDSNFGTSSTSYELIRPYFYLRDFNIDNYMGVDSVVFMAYLDVSRSTVKGTMQLFDVTNNTVIPNTTLFSNSTNYKLCKTGNLITSLPHESINVAIRLKTSKSGYSFSVVNAKLILYRK